MDDSSAFGPWLKKKRKAMGLTQGALAERLGYSRNMLRKVESGTRKPSEQMCELLATFFEIDPSRRDLWIRWARGIAPATGTDSRGAGAAVHAGPSVSLPTALTSLIGREDEISSLSALLCGGHRLVTLTGPGGVGKTRLAGAVASALQHEFSGVTFVELAAVRDPSRVLPAIARALGLKEGREGHLQERVIRSLREREHLLVLDNFEQLLAAAPVVSRLLAEAPPLTVLLTSREILNLYGEVEFPLSPLSLPGPGGAPSDLVEADAVALFVERTQAIRPDFPLTEENLTAIADLCSRLDGLPLAIELAAARVRIFSPRAMVERLSDRYDWLTTGARDLPARHRSLEQAMDWSYELLEPAERTLFERLALFSGSASLDAVTALYGEEATGGVALPDRLTSLVEKSLLRDAGLWDGDVRFVMLETIREYAASRLEHSGDAEALRRRHAGYFLRLAEQAAPELVGPEQAGWLERLERDHDNFRVALEWSLNAGNDGETALRLVGALWRFWFIGGHISEGRRWLDATLTHPSDTAPLARARALVGAGHLAWKQGEYEQAQAQYEESLSLFEAMGAREGMAEVLHRLGSVMRDLGRFERARSLYNRCLALQREREDRAGVAAALIASGELHRCQGEYARAGALYEESLGLFEALGDRRGIAVSLHNLAHVAQNQGKHEEAARRYMASISHYQAVIHHEGIAVCLAGLAQVAMLQGQPERAVHLFGAAERVLDEVGAVIEPADRADYERSRAAARSALGEEEFDRLRASGSAVTLEEATRYAASSIGDVGDRSRQAGGR